MTNYMKNDRFETVKVDIHSVNELFEMLRAVPLQTSQIYPYADSEITMTRTWNVAGSNNIRIDKGQEVLPTQRYILANDIRKLLARNESLYLYDQRTVYDLVGDSIHKDIGYITVYYKTVGDDTIRSIDIIPPIIEQDDAGCCYVCDGHTRLYMSMYFQKPITCVLIKNPGAPFYAEPIRSTFGGWNTMELFEDTIPANFVKKIRRFADSHFYYRDFNAVFNNISGSRGNESTPMVTGPSCRCC